MRALEIRHKHFHAALGDSLADGADGEGEEFGTAVLTIVAIDAGDHRELQAERRACLRYSPRFVVVDREGSPFLHRAKSATARAHVAEDHERRRAAIPALADI